MNFDAIGELVKHIAQQEILPRFKNLQAEDITEKSLGELVSIADTETERALSCELKKLFPSAIIGGEETIAKTPDLLQDIISADRAFLIDPVDGTNNFIKGNERFALMMTELRKSEVVAAWIYLPVADKIAVAEKGAGVQLNGKDTFMTSQSVSYENMIPAAHINRFPEDLRKIAKEGLKNFKENKPAFCAGFDYVSLLEGEKDFSLYHRTLPWDHLPGAFMVAQAGGYVRTLVKERDYTIHDQLNGLLSVANEEQWHYIRELIFPKYF